MRRINYLYARLLEDKCDYACPKNPEHQSFSQGKESSINSTRNGCAVHSIVPSSCTCCNQKKIKTYVHAPTMAPQYVMPYMTPADDDVRDCVTHTHTHTHILNYDIWEVVLPF